MMKAIILSMGLISIINASSQRLLQQTTCAQVRCASGTFCTEDPIAGAQCVSCAATTCPFGQECQEGIGCTPITCDGVNEEYNTCGSACPRVCGVVDGPDNCIAVCVQGCFCADGYIRDTNGDCIPESNCQSLCGINEEFTACNGHCRPTCETGPNIICTKQCEAGCNCIDGYILDETDGTCIPEKECPADTTSEPTLPPGCALILCQVGSTCCDDGNGGAKCCPTTPEECPLRCEAGFDGCNDCFCDGLGNTGGCTKRGCPSGPIAPAGCKTCEVGYQLNTITNECESAKVSCSRNRDCDSGFKCRKDPECKEYSDLKCSMTGKVCVTRRGLDIPCNSDSDCDEANGFACLDGDNGDGRCVKYQSPY